MSIQLKGTLIERPLEEVFTFFSDFENSPRWGRTIRTVKDSSGPIGVGTVFLEEAKIMGRTMQHRSEVVVYDRPREFAYTNHFANGMSERARFTFESVADGTLMKPEAEVEWAKVPQLMAPLLSWLMKRQVRALFKKFKQAVEAADRPET